MGLEVATYIEDLVETNPLGTDTKAQGDNHIRLIKKVLGTQFPNLGGEALTPSAAQINDLFDNNRAMPTGGIIMWSGAVVDVPTGWSLCDGNNGTPNLVGRFVIGSGDDVGGAYDVGDVGGSKDIVSSTEGHALTINEMPSHSHDTNYSNYMHSEGSGGYDSGPGHRPRSLVIQPTGGDEPHSHDLNLVDGNLPPYLALAYIMKL